MKGSISRRVAKLEGIRRDTEWGDFLDGLPDDQLERLETVVGSFRHGVTVESIEALSNDDAEFLYSMVRQKEGQDGDAIQEA